MRRSVPLFDLGNVIVRVDFAPFLGWLSARSEEKDPAAAAALLTSPLFHDFEFGNIGAGEFADRLAALFRADFTRAELEQKFCDIFPGPVEGMPELLEELAREAPVYYLSNTNEVHLRWLRAHRPETVRPFAKVFASHELRGRKPDPDLYRAVARELGVEPGGIVFFDDLEANLEGARRAGLEAHLFRDTEQVRRRLKGIGPKADKT